jgi:enterochelin esterase family protein
MNSRNSILSLVVIAITLSAAAADQQERTRQPGVPQGKVTSGEFAESKLFPETKRQYSVYVPAQYKGDQPASLMVFMDGSGYVKENGDFRVPIVFDNLIHQQAMPVTIAVFVNPGTVPATKAGGKERSNRSFEYDSLGDRYANFLVDEFLPVALKGLGSCATVCFSAAAEDRGRAQ